MCEGVLFLTPMAKCILVAVCVSEMESNVNYNALVKKGEQLAYIKPATPAFTGQITSRYRAHCVWILRLLIHKCSAAGKVIFNYMFEISHALM
jgi:hypothetical protein